MSKSTKQSMAWVVTHCEVNGRQGGARSVSSLAFHVSSSLERAEAFIRARGSGFEQDSWWEIRGFFVDCDDEDLDDTAQLADGRYYGYTGRQSVLPRLGPSAPWLSLGYEAGMITIHGIARCRCLFVE